MPVVRGANSENLAPGLIMRSFNAYREKPEIFSRIVNVKTSTKAFEENFARTGFGPLVEHGELERTYLDEPTRLGGVRWIHKKYKLGYVISEEMQDDDQYNLAMDLSSALGRSARYTAELYGHDVYNNAFSTSRYTGRDGKALVASDHPLYGGSAATASNLVTGDFDEVSLESAWLKFQTQVDDKGMPIDIMPSILLMHPTKVPTARRVLESASLNAYGTNPGEINPFQGMLRIISSPYLTDTDAFFVLADISELGVVFWWRKRPDTRTWDDNDSDAVFHKIMQRHSVGFDDWRGVVGSQGA